jgi:hypothetical protein
MPTPAAHQPIRLRTALLVGLLKRWLEIDNWVDDLIAPADLVRETQSAVDGRVGLRELQGPTAPARSVGTFLVANPTGTVIDELNGLEWQAQDDGKSRNFKDAEAYCKSLNLGGPTTGDWRLPTEQELLSLVDRERYNPAINPELFPGTKSAFYWSSTPYAFNPADDAWGVDFNDGYTLAYHRSSNNGFVRAVRSVAPASPGQ